MVHLGAICEFSEFLLGSSERFFADYFGRSQGLGLVRKGERKGDNTKTKTKAKQKKKKKFGFIKRVDKG